MSPNWWQHATDDVCMLWLMLSAIGWCPMATMCGPGFMSMSLSTQTTVDACTHLLLSPALADVIWFIHTCHRWCALSIKSNYDSNTLANEYTTLCIRACLVDVACSWLILLSRCTYATAVHAYYTGVSCHWPRLLYRYSHSTSVCGGLWWTLIPLDDVTF